MRQIDDKYQTNGDITKLDGAPVPEDEPLILFRAKDKLLVKMLDYYQKLCRDAGSPESQTKTLQSRIDTIKAWQANHQDKLKVPD